MKRRSEGGHPIKRRPRRAVGHKAPKRRIEDRLTTDLQAQVDILTRELKESREEQMATADVLQAISQSTFDLQTVLDALVKAASRLCAANTEIFRRIGDGYRLSASCGYSRAYNEYVGSLNILPGKETLAGRTAHEGRTVHIPDVFADPDYNLPEAQKLGHWRAMLGIPLLREGIAVGVFAFKRPAAGSFTKAEIELAKTFANQALIAIENTRLLNELRESLQQQTATVDVLRIISASPGELEPVFSAILQNATRICEARFGTLYRFDGLAFYHAAGHGTPDALIEVQKRQGHFVPEPGTLMHRVMNTKAAAHSADYAAESALGLSAKFGGARSTVVVPMLKDNALVGAFAIYRQEVRPFTEKQIALLENFAAQAVIAIENARLLNEQQESLQRQTATADVLKVISSSPGELEPVFNAMLANATKLCEASYGALWLREGDAFRTAALHGDFMSDQWRIGSLFRPGPEVLLARVGSLKRPLQVPDLGVDASYLNRDPLPVAAVEIAGVRTLLSVPMIKGEELVGAIAIYRKEVKPFGDKQIELVENFAAQAVIAIENARLLNELRQRTDDLSEALEQQTATSKVLSVISSSPGELEPVFKTMLENATRLCEARYGTMWLREGDAFRAASLHGPLPPAYIDLLRSGTLFHPSPDTPTGLVVQTRQPVQVPDLRETRAYFDREPILVAAVEVAGVRTMFSVPMLKEGQLVGTISIYRQEMLPFTDKQIELVQNFAAQAVIAIENARLLSELRQRTTDLSQSLEDLRTTQDRLVQTQKLALLGQLTAGIAHEIKNPLNFVNNFSGISAELIDELQGTLKAIPLDDKIRAEVNELTGTLKSNFDKVVRHGRRADAIVKNMLQHSREGSGEHRVVDINALVEESLNLAWHGARAETPGFEIKLKQSFDPSAGEADIFPQDMRRALLNVISNGFYAATKRRAETNGGDYEPTLMASTKNHGDRVEIRIHDNGTGMTPDVKEKMFNPFFTTEPTGEGTGLGFSISHDIIVKQHGGSIEVDTQAGDFTEIRVILPRIAALLPDHS